MSKDEGGGGGAVGKLWRRHGKGFYALLAVGTFLYLEVKSLVSSAASAETMQGFVTSELTTFFIESVINTVSASIWPWTWYRGMGVAAAYWAIGLYLLWAILLGLALSRRERALRKELGI